jgi:hypothetical protein
VFTARYALSPYIKQIRFVFKGLMTHFLIDDGEVHLLDVSVTNYRIMRVLASWSGSATKVMSVFTWDVTSRNWSGSICTDFCIKSASYRLLILLLYVSDIMEAQRNGYFRLYFAILSQNRFPFVILIRNFPSTLVLTFNALFIPLILGYEINL